ncbi:MAG: DUF2065 domain-containing protein [Nevskiales bacterium]
MTPLWADLLRALCLVMIIEGLWPLLAPERWKSVLTQVIGMDSRSLRIAGAVAVGSGLILLHLLRQ